MWLSRGTMAITRASVVPEVGCGLILGGMRDYCLHVRAPSAVWSVWCDSGNTSTEQRFKTSGALVIAAPRGGIGWGTVASKPPYGPGQGRCYGPVPPVAVRGPGPPAPAALRLALVAEVRESRLTDRSAASSLSWSAEVPRANERDTCATRTFAENESRRPGRQLDRQARRSKHLAGKA